MTQRARALRRDSTHPERLLWQLLRARELNGHKFRRQQAIGPFVADFCCPAARLVIEIDGLSHEDPEADARRTAYLKARGFSVLRVTNDQVLKERSGVLDTILEAVESRLGCAEDATEEQSGGEFKT